MATFYPYLLDPKRHPDYERRHVKVPTWETFGNRHQFMALRGFEIKDKQLVNWRETLDDYTVRFKLGDIVWPVFPTVFTENFWELVEEIRERDLYLFDIWGHVPGSGGRELWGHVMPRPGMVERLEEMLGERFLGFDNGEQDGRYVGGYADQQCPSSTDRFAHYLNFQRHFERMCDDLGNHMTTLVSLSFGHYFLKEGNHTLIGAETAQALPNSQIYYAFIRGAGKQYGIPWFGNVSVFNRWAYKDYQQVGTSGEGYRSGPDVGTSLSLMKRLMYTHYLYNCVAGGFESGWIVERDGEKELSPIGLIQAGAARFVEEHGQPGVMHAPVALLLDFFSGWAVPRHLYTSKIYQSWGGVPYDAGDYLTHATLSMIYPGYEDASYYRNERGFLSPTPYGDFADCLLTDSASWTLSQYGLVIAAGTLGPKSANRETRDTLDRFMSGGGGLVVTADNARVLWPEWGVGEPESIPPGSTIHFSDGTEIAEDDAFALCALPSTESMEVLAECGGKPAIVQVSHGSGSAVMILSPMGLNSEPLFSGPVENAEEKPLRCPYRMLKHVTHLMDRELRAQQMFNVGDGLSFIACRKSEGVYTVGIQNNGLAELPFAITSPCGTVTGVRELPLDCSEKGARGYFPEGFTPDAGESTTNTIAGGDVRLFEVTLAEDEVRLISEAEPPVPVKNRLLAFRGIESVKERILEYPTFFAHFDGIMLDWHYLRIRSAEQIEREKGWLERQSLRIVVDFSSGLNFYPDLTLLDNLQMRYDESVEAIDEVLDKMQLIGSTEAVITLHREPEFPTPKEEIADGFLRGVRELCKRAEQRGITLHLQHRPGELEWGVDLFDPDNDALVLLQHPVKWHGSPELKLQFIEKVGAPNLRFALNTGHAIMEGHSLGDAMKTVSAAGATPGCVLVNASTVDAYGQSYDVHHPVAGSGLDLSPLAALPADTLVILDATYDGWDAVYADVCIIEETSTER